MIAVERGNQRVVIWAKWLLAAWVAGALLFAHGCHGDEDHELFTSIANHSGTEDTEKIQLRIFSVSSVVQLP
jgi:hypothetical protein